MTDSFLLAAGDYYFDWVISTSDPNQGCVLESTLDSTTGLQQHFAADLSGKLQDGGRVRYTTVPAGEYWFDVRAPDTCSWTFVLTAF